MLQEIQPLLEKFDKKNKKEDYYDLEGSVGIGKTFYLRMIDSDLHIYNVRYCSRVGNLVLTNEVAKLNNYKSRLYHAITTFY